MNCEEDDLGPECDVSSAPWLPRFRSFRASRRPGRSRSGSSFSAACKAARPSATRSTTSKDSPSKRDYSLQNARVIIGHEHSFTSHGTVPALFVGSCALDQNFGA